MYSYKDKRNVHFKCNPIPSLNIGKINQRTISQLFFFFWLVIVLSLGISSAFTVSKLFQKSHVLIFNDLDNEVLFFHIL